MDLTKERRVVIADIGNVVIVVRARRRHTCTKDRVYIVSVATEQALLSAESEKRRHLLQVKSIGHVTLFPVYNRLTVSSTTSCHHFVMVD